MSKIRVVVVDDSPVIRNVLEQKLNKLPDIEVVGTALDPYEARDLIAKLKPDVLSLDINMPRMDGITFLKKLMQFYPMPVVVLSSLTREGSPIFLEALAAGACAVLQKPTEQSRYSVDHLISDLRVHIREAFQHTPVKRKAATQNHELAVADGMETPQRHLVAVGASTGGTEAILNTLSPLPVNTPGVVIVQHMPEQFTASFANRLNDKLKLTVKLAETGEKIETGHAYLCPGSHHLVVERGPNGYRIRLNEGPKVSGHRPSVDVLFTSVAAAAGRDAVGVLLTGMGADGARGMKKMHNAGVWTLAQDENSCVVFGMPREAIALEAVDEVVGISLMGRAVSRAVMKKKPPVGAAVS